MTSEPGMIDLFVIGGGINGAGIARDAAGRGLSVVLCEKEELFRQTEVGALCDGHLLVLILYELLYAREGMVQESPLLVVVGLWVVSTSQEVLCLPPFTPRRLQ